MSTPLDIIITHEFPEDDRRQKPHFRVDGFDRKGQHGFIKLPNIKDLIAWLAQHDYRYVPASRGHWRLP